MIIHSRKGARKPEPATKPQASSKPVEVIPQEKRRRRYRVIEKQPEKEELKGE